MPQTDDERAAQDARETQIVLAIIFGLVMGGATGLTVGLMTSRGCEHIEVKDAPWGCFEFALARYQTLFAALIAGLIAAYAARPVFRQLSEMRRQSAAMAQSTVSTLIGELLGEKSTAEEALFWVGVEFDKVARAGWLFDPHYHALVDQASKARQPLFDHIRRSLGPPDLQEARQQTMTSVSILLSAYGRFGRGRAQQQEIAAMTAKLARFWSDQRTYSRLLEDSIKRVLDEEQRLFTELLGPDVLS